MITNSISKIKKIKAHIKKWTQKGFQENSLKKKPHSKGDGFSILISDFKEKKTEINKKIKAKTLLKNK